MTDHFAAVAGNYNLIRTTDPEPVARIADALRPIQPFRAADLGCGAGRYSRLLVEALPGTRIFCVDASPEMCAQARLVLPGRAIVAHRDAEAFLGEVWPPLEAIFCMNAVHHLGLYRLLKAARRPTRPGARLFIYTRTRSQNARSVWGRHFPGFADTETRLYEEDEIRESVRTAGGWRLAGMQAFAFPRAASIARLVFLARSKHYSTFALYSPAELDWAVEEFGRNLRAAYPDPENVTWEDANLLVTLERTS